MKPFEVGVKAIWKGGCIMKAYGTDVKGMRYEKGSEITYKGYSLVRAYPLLFEFPDGEQWGVSLDQIELPTPTTTVTVHGNENWKPEQEQIGWKIEKWFPMDYDRGLIEKNMEHDGYHFKVGSQTEQEWSPLNHPDFFSPVYSKGKPIEFVKYWNNRSDKILPIAPEQQPHNWKEIVLVTKGYANGDMDLMFARSGIHREDTMIAVLGHFNSGIV